MIRHGYHSYRGPAYRGMSLDRNGYGVGVELETDVHMGLFASARTVRGVRPERDGSLDSHTGVEFIFGASDNLRQVVSRFNMLRERTDFGTRDRKSLYGCHININAVNKSSTWRKLMALSCVQRPVHGVSNVLFLRQIGRRIGYSPFPVPSSYALAHILHTKQLRYVGSIYGHVPGTQGDKYAIALRTNRVEYRMFKTCDKLETLLLYILFAQAWSRWITHLEATLPADVTVFSVYDAVEYTRFIEWLESQPQSSERDAVLNLSRACSDSAAAQRPYMNEDEYISSAGEAINEVCRSLSTPQRRSRRTSPVAVILPPNQAGASLAAA